MDTKKKILIVDDDKSVLTSLLILFRHHNFDPTIESDPKEIRNLILNNEFEAIILDMNFRRGYNEGKEGIYWLELIKQINSEIKVLLITAYGDINLAVDAIKKGASDFILKPWENDKLISKVESLLSKKDIVQKKKNTKELFGESTSINNIKGLIDKAVSINIPVHIHGEVGTGKKLIAEIILEKSNISKYKIINFSTDTDLSNISDNNSFKGIILNNIDLCNSSEQMQLKKLISENNSIKYIATSSGNLNKLNSFIKDEFGLLNIETKPLRDNKESILQLANNLLIQLAEKYDRKVNSFSEKAKLKIASHHWPENVKELKHTIERAVILSEADSLSEADIKIEQNSHVSNSSYSGTLNLLELEKEAILKAIEDSEGNITKAAKTLGITRTALYRRMEKHEI